ncbi:hypothetical protein J3R82DRAFT_4945 [Butyriboletus roseoflavus]|nr:hypothetical protein J3R82DRAFT_4945 [Butyriboletus roseoflavus]
MSRLSNSSLGSYSAKGGAIVLHTLLRLFPSQTMVTDAFKPLPYHHYFTYFLVPHIVANLIAEDLSTTVLNAHWTMISSSNAGELLHPKSDDNPKLDAIYRQNINFFRTWKPPTNGTISGAIDSGIENATNALLKLKGEALGVCTFNYYWF